MPEEKLAPFRREFAFWYPMDMRVSGKDLIPNHLTMSLYNHAAVWKGQPQMWPKSFFCNGHVQVDGERAVRSVPHIGRMRCTRDIRYISVTSPLRLRYISAASATPVASVTSP